MNIILLILSKKCVNAVFLTTNLVKLDNWLWLNFVVFFTFSPSQEEFSQISPFMHSKVVVSSENR